MVKKSPRKPRQSQKAVFKNLNTWNLVLAGLHFVQGVAVLILSRAHSLPVTTNYLTLDTVASKTNQPVLAAASRHMFDVNLAYLVASFLFLAALTHLIMATQSRQRYEKDLKRGINRARWYEHSLSFGVIMLVVVMLSGVYDASSLLMILGLNFVAGMMGLLMEVHNQGAQQLNWLSFGLGCLSGFLPWLVVAFYAVGTFTYGSSHTPNFVYAIYATAVIFACAFAANLFLQYKKIGKWADYIYGERIYMILSVLAKSALAWQVFFGALKP